MAWLGAAAALATSPIGQQLQRVIISAITQQGTRVLRSEDVPQVSNADAVSVATATANASVKQVTERVLETILNDPDLGKAVSVEPIAQSKNLWLAFAGIAGSLAAGLTLIGNGNFDVVLLGGIATGLAANLGLVWRRVRMGWRVQAKVEPAGTP